MTKNQKQSNPTKGRGWLTEWLNQNPNSNLNGRVYDSNKDPTLNSLQVAHKNREINLYAPVEAYNYKWKHYSNDDDQFVSCSRIEESRKRDDLPPVAVQWSQDFKRKQRNGKSTRSRRHPFTRRTS